MKPKDFITAVGDELDKHFLPPGNIEAEIDMEIKLLSKEFMDDLFYYWNRNIAPEIAAEMIAHKAGLSRIDRRS
jgi:hypothetical protein